MSKRYNLVMVAAVTLGSFGFVPGASAAPKSVTADTQIQVHAKIAPTHYVTIDPDGEILEIASNTTEDVKPRIYVNSVATANEVPLTDDVFVFYQFYVPAGTSKVGILYKRNSVLSNPASLSSRSLLQQIR